MRGTALLALVLFCLALSPPVWAETLSQSNGQTPQERAPISLPQAVRDVGVTGIQASTLSVPRGEVVTIQVTAQNFGSNTEQFSLFLKDDADGRDITSVVLTLNSGQTLTVGLPWNTSSASGGSHNLTTHVILGGDQNPANDSLSLSAPVEVTLIDIVLGDSRDLNKPDAFFGSGLQSANIATQLAPMLGLFIGGHDADFDAGMSLPAVTTSTSPRVSVYVAGADATFQPAVSLQDPFQQGEIRGLVHLQGLSSSSGAYIEAGTARHFVTASGEFGFLVPNGTYDLVINAPGYVAVRIPNTLINPGETLAIPELTLPFGDANGDGRIDILDLSIAAGNFGATVTEVSVP